MMMGGMMLIWLIVLFVIAVRVVGPRLASRGGLSSTLPRDRERTPEELARERYARGEIAAPEYQELLVNLLKDRYVEGELDLAGYEERASHVLDEGALVPTKGTARLNAPAAVSRTPTIDVLGRSTTAENTADSGYTPEARTESALDVLRQRFLSGALTYQEYDEQRRRLTAA